MFPLTEEERVSRIRSDLAKAEEKAKTKRDSAMVALDEATEKWVEASALLETFDAMAGVVAAAHVAYSAPEGVDPVTGEVTTPAPAVPMWAEGIDPERAYAATRLVIATGAASVAMLQRRLNIGYEEAGRLLDALETAGIVAPSSTTKAPAGRPGPRSPAGC